jgi:AcrR family transcriptional regulator
MPRSSTKGETPPSPRFRQRPTIDVRLLEGMEKLISEGETFSAVSVERLAMAAGIGRATFYKHFRDKGELISHLFEQVREEIVAAAGMWFEDASTTTRADLARTLRGILGVYRRHRVVFSAMAQTAATNEDVARLSFQMRHELCLQSRKALRQLRQAGRALPGADDLVADLLTFAIDHCSTLEPQLLEGRSFERLVEGWAHISWNALGMTEPAP